MTSSLRWSIARRIGFRFAFVLGVLLIYPFPIGSVPGTDALEKALSKPLDWGAAWLAQSVLGLPDPTLPFNGSGDRTLDYVRLLLMVIVAVGAAIVWSVVDRRRPAYPRLAAGLRILLRYYVAFVMLTYGILKIWKGGQFSDPPPSWLHQRIGDGSPMRLLWAFMGYSQPYTMFAGFLEAIGGALLLWRRTTTLGALIVMAVMTNVMVLNLCYDVPVKIFSTTIVIMAAAIAFPAMRRLASVALGHAAAAVPLRVRMSRRLERLRLVAKVALIGLIAYYLYDRYVGRGDDPVHELYGNWEIETFVADGVEHPPLTTDPIRWQTVSINERSVTLWLTSGVRAPSNIDRASYRCEVDSASHTIKVTLDRVKNTTETWRYARPATDHLVIDGAYDGRSLHVTLHLLPEGLLMTRGFHWINEVPFNR